MPPDLHDRIEVQLENSQIARYGKSCLVYQMAVLIICLRLTLMVPLLVRPSQHVPAVNVTGGKAAAIAKSDKLKWDVKTEPFHAFHRRVMIWAESHGIEHLLMRPPAGDMSDFECHNVARRTILLALSSTDTDYTADTTYLCEAWQLLLQRHEPSRDIEVSDLYQKLSVATQRGRNMGDHVNECMTYRNRLKALGTEIPREFLVQKLLDVDKEHMFMRVSAPSPRNR